MRKGKGERVAPDVTDLIKRFSLSFVKKTARQKPGDRHQGAGSRAGQAVRDWKERFWKGEGECEGERETFSPKRFPSPPHHLELHAKTA